MPSIVGSQLTENGQRLKLAGACIWALPGHDAFTSNFANGCYGNRGKLLGVIKSWGGNIVRLRFSGTTVAQGGFGLTAAQHLDRIQALVTDAKAAGLYVLLCDWDSHDTPTGNWYDSGNLATFLGAHKAIHDRLGPDLSVMYEPWNEPDKGSLSQWTAAMMTTIDFYRDTIGYKGPLFLDTQQGSSSYDGASFDQLAAHDTAKVGSNQLAVVHHNYAMGKTSFDSAGWAGRSGGGKYVVLESEWGYWVDTATGSGPDSYMQQEATFLAGNYAAEPSYAGHIGFLLGPWSDPNAMTAADYTTPTHWGSMFQKALQASNVTSAVPTTPPPTTPPPATPPPTTPPPTTPPPTAKAAGVPLGLTVSALVGGATTVSWSPPASDGGSPITGYKVGRDGTDTAGNGPWGITTPAAARSQQFTKLGTTPYVLSVAAVNAAGVGPAAMVAVNVPPPTTPPPAPTPALPADLLSSAPLTTVIGTINQMLDYLRSKGV